MIDEEHEKIDEIIAMSNSESKMELLISGRALSHLLLNPELEQPLTKLLSVALAVLVFRASPA
jgi:hypothetical protein